MVGVTEGFSLRPANPGDNPAIIRLLCDTLGWEDDERHRSLFEWKHQLNPFGVSPCWVAEDEGGLIGFRTLMRWGFRCDREPVSTVRAVDTATSPRAQGRGVFRALTMRAVEEMTSARVAWVFNTPNDRSAPGYLSMGWRSLGRLPVSVFPGPMTGWPRLLSARQAGDLWSVPTSAGEDAEAVLRDERGLGELLAGLAQDEGTHTERSAAFLMWRYGAGPVRYRALLPGGDLRNGIVFFRLRRRGRATEAVVLDALFPQEARRLGPVGLARAVLKASGADYVIALGSSRPRGWLPVPGQGPVLTWRALATTEPPPLDAWGLTTGDIELF